MKIKFKQKKLNISLAQGILWLVLGGFAIIDDPSFSIRYIYLMAGILFIVSYLYDTKYQYLIISKDTIKMNSIFPKKIKFTEIIQFKKFAGDYILRTNQTELVITTSLIDKESLDDLDRILNEKNITIT